VVCLVKNANKVRLVWQELAITIKIPAFFAKNNSRLAEDTR